LRQSVERATLNCSAIVLTAAGVDRPLYEIAALAELRNSLRSVDVWVPGSRQFRDFEEYMTPPAQFARLDGAGTPGIALEAELKTRAGSTNAVASENGRLSGVRN
jgi:hypothetical protein